MSRLLRGIFTLILLLPALRPHETRADEAFQFGFCKADITPEEPLRLPGYGNRTEPFTGCGVQLCVPLHDLWRRS